MVATIDTPMIVVVALELGQVQSNFRGEFLGCASKFRSFLRQYPPKYLLSIRAMKICVLSKLDSLVHGNALPAPFFLSFRPTVNTLHQLVLSLGADAPGCLAHPCVRWWVGFYSCAAQP